ncbi:MAG: marine proteobacterial sortase target protein [Hyphomicrobiaceae bacterium]
MKMTTIPLVSVGGGSGCAWLDARRLPVAGATWAIAAILAAAAVFAHVPPARGEVGQASPPATAQPPVQAKPPAPANEPEPTQKRTSPGEMRSGGLLLRTPDGGYIEAPRLGADYDVTVSGPTARARVTQMFSNPGTTHVEAVYVYPLPEGAAVDTLKMVIGERVVIGSIKERQAAKIIYERAKAEGRKAALVEQERPNLFTNSVANIGPGETVVVQIEYQEPVRRSGTDFSLRIPLVVAPRYNPQPLVQTVDLGAEGWGRSVSDPVPDRKRIEPDYLDPRTHAPINPVTIKVRLAAGFPLGDVKSAYHPIKTETVDEATRIISLDTGATPANRDFELTWHPAAQRAPAVGLFREHVAGADYVLAFVTPPTVDQPEAVRQPREMILVLDNSGSMGGQSIRQAKASLAYALTRLKPEDRFNVIRFNHTMDSLFSHAMPADPANIARAAGWVDALKAEGGTEMLPALKAALADPQASDSRYLRQVVFLTDGAIGNEQQLLDTIASSRGRSRIFTVGIGSAPNSYLMTRGAELGRGTFTHIGAVTEVEARMRALFEKLESPVVTGLVANFGDNATDITPSPLPDLYRGEPIVIAARQTGSGGTLQIKGSIGDQPWVVTLPLANSAAGKGLSKLWARRKIADAEVARTLRKLTPPEADKAILALALEHHLVSRLTSLVAVDDVVSRKPGAPLTRADIPLNLPAGWDFDKVFGKPSGRLVPSDTRADSAAPQRQTDGAFTPTSATGRLVTKPHAKPNPVMATQGTQQVVQLPATATDAELRLLAGLALLLLSVTIILLQPGAWSWPRRSHK